MKNHFGIWITTALLLANAGFLHGAPNDANQQPPAQPTEIPAPTPYAVTVRDANSRVWERTEYELGSSGQIVPKKHSYTELATGLHYWSNGQWVESKEEIDVQPNGTASATQGQHQAYFPGDIYQGQIELVTPDGQHLKSRPAGLSYFDGQNSVLIAELKDSVGVVSGNNQVIYPDAFTDFKADLVYTYTKAGFEQDIVLREQPPTPESFGLNSQNTRLQVLTEFFDTAGPAQATSTVNPQDGLNDTTLTFGQMKMLRGKAFSFDDSTQTSSRFGGISVYKSWQHLEGRTFLVEELPFQKIEIKLEQLPLPTSGNTTVSSVNSVRHKVSTARLLPPTRLVQSSTNTLQMAKVKLNSKSGLVLDYVAFDYTSGDVTFQGDTTYYIDGGNNVYGTATIEGGAVIKFKDSGESWLSLEGSLNCQTAPYRPAVFTSVNDNTVGETISGSSGTPTLWDGGNYNYFLFFDGSSISYSPHDLRFCYAFTGLGGYDTGPDEVRDCQFLQCQYGMDINSMDKVRLHNVLFAGCSYVASIDQGGSFMAENMTADVTTSLWDDNNYGDPSTCDFTNCIIRGDIPSGITLNTNHVIINPAGTVFQTVGGGNYYLTNDSPYRNIGTTNISSALLAELHQKTTYPPLVFSNITISIATNFSIQASRDTNVLPDLGYHYDPIDYFFGGVTASSNLTFNAGTAVGWFELPGSGGPGYGIALSHDVTSTFNGTATAPCIFARYDTVQEGGNGDWADRGYLGGIICQTNGTTPAINAQFTHFAALNNDPNHIRDYYYTIILNATHCEFWSGKLAGYGIVLNLKNCLIDRQVQLGPLSSGGLSLQNCTMHGGELEAARGGSTWPVYIVNSAFDGSTFSMDDPSPGNPSVTYRDYNAFLTGANRSVIGGAHDVTNLLTFNWQTNWLGNYYQPTNSPLIDRGNTTANLLGLYHFTTQTNQVKETSSTVDIGYHYVATDSSGNPFDYDGDGVPDYLEDANGNGVDDSGESPWDLGIISQPQSLNVVQGQNAAFSVTAGGAGPFSYHWWFNGINISGATGSSYTNLVVQTNSAGNYSVVISNTTASVTSSIAVLSVTVPLVITNQPVSQTVIKGTNVSFSVGVSGNYLVYQWYSNGVAINNSSRITGATGSTLTISNVAASDATSYYAVVTNLFGSVTSASATLTVITNPWVSSSPTNTIVIQSDDVIFYMTATSVGLGYQWWLTNTLGTNAIAGATNANYTKLVVQTNDDGHYSVIITNAAGGTNAHADLTVQVPPWITQQPSNISTNQGSTAVFSVNAIGTTNLIYQWFKFGTNAILNATNSSLTLSNVQTNDACGYSVLVTNIAGTNFSAWAWLSVTPTRGTITNGWGNSSTLPSTAPSVSMISPTNAVANNAAVFLYGPPISIRASASSQYGFITNVVFYYTATNYVTNFMVAGTAVPGANTKFALAWTNSLPGTNVLRAVAQDNSGVCATSSVVYVIMVVPPTFSAGPDTNVVWTEGASGTNISFSGSVSNDGQPYSLVTNVQWSVLGGNASYASIANSNSLTPLVTFSTNGVFVMQLRVDNGFATNTQTCKVTIKRRPQVHFNSPTNNALILSGTPIVLNATAYDLDGTITNVEFYSNSVPLGAGIQSLTNAYTLLWTNAPLWTNSVSAVATDNDGLTSTSSVSVVIVPPLAVQFVSPTNGQLFVLSPTNFGLTAQAISYAGATVTSVVFSNQTQSIHLGAGTALTNSNWQLWWQAVTNGTYTVKATAWDSAGNVATSSVAIIVNAMPVVSIITPTNIQSFLEVTNVTLVAQAFDAEDGTNVLVRFYYTNSFIGWATNILGTNLFSFRWTNRYPNYYPITAVATDNRGASSVSPIGVFKVLPTNAPPTVAITYPTNNEIFAADSDITITATATNFPASVTNVEFFVNGQLLGSDSDDPYSINECCWKPGTYVLEAKATDSFGSSFVSTNVTVIINEDTPIAGQGFWDAKFGQGAKQAISSAPFPYNFSSYFVGLSVGPTNSIFAAANDVADGYQSIIFQSYGATNWPINAEIGQYFYAFLVDGTNVYEAGDTGNANYLSLWNGVNWTNVGDELNDYGYVYSIAKIAGDLYIGGKFGILKLNVAGNHWEPVGSGSWVSNGNVYAIASLNNELYIGGSFTGLVGNTNINYIACYKNNIWTNLGIGVSGISANISDGKFDGTGGTVTTLSACGTNLFVGGFFNTAGGITNANGVAIWNTKWQTMGNGVGLFPDYFGISAPQVLSIVAHGNHVFVGGAFTNVNSGGQNIPANNIAMATWSEVDQTWTWTDLDGGVSNTEGYRSPVTQCAIANGITPGSYDLYIVGLFDVVGSSQISSSTIARWRVGYPLPPGVPTVTITNPVNASIFTNTNSITIAAIASSYTNINHVEFFADGQDLGGDWDGAGGSYNWSWHPPYGLTLLTASAVDANGLQGNSSPVLINVMNPAGTVIASNDTFTILMNDPPINLNVLANDITTTNGKLRVIVAYMVQGNAGTVQASYDGSGVVYKPNLNKYGTDIFAYSVTDGTSTNSAYVTVSIKARPVVTVSPPGNGQQFGTSSNVTIGVSASAYGGLVTNINVYLNNTAYGQTNTNTISSIWQTNLPAFYTFTAVATDNSGYTNVSSPVTIAVTNSDTATNILTASIDNLPATSVGLGMVKYTVVTQGVYDLLGQAKDSHVGDPVSYQLLLFQPDDSDTPIANVTPGSLDAAGFHQGGDNGGDLGKLDLTGIPNGTYDLQLTVHGGGGQTSTTARFTLDSQLKIGQFSFSEQDVILPVSGIPITVTRTYNSLNPLASDFGYSWSYALNSMDVSLDEDREDITMGTDQAPEGDEEESGNGLPLVVSVRTGGSRDVTLTLPDGRRTTFAFVPGMNGNDADANWKAAPGVTAKLTPMGAGTIQFTPYLYWTDGGENSTFDNYDVPGWVLTTQDGTQYYITRGNGNFVTYQDPNNSGKFINTRAYGPPKLTSIVQRSGDTIVISDSSIYHQGTNGVINRAVAFSRDSQNRITAIFDPNTDTNGPPTVQYVYNQDTGNLIQVIKLVNLATSSYTTNKYHYDNASFPHYITSIENGNGVPVAQNFYDDSGRLTAVQDADGNLTKFVHNITNDMEVVIDRLGHTNTYVYDPFGNVTAQTNALGQVKTMAYDGNNNKTNEVTYLNGQPYSTNSSIYDLNLNLPLVTTDPLGHTNSFTYDPYGDPLTSTDARGNSMTNFYDSYGNLVSTADALGNTTVNSYGNGLLISSQDALNTVTTNSYDNNQNLVATATLDALGNILSTNTFAYDDNGNRTNSTVWRKVGNAWTPATTTYIYDSLNRVTQTIDPDGGTNTVVYDAIGKQQATLDKLGRTTTYTYDAQGRLFLTTYPDSTTETSAYDAAGNRTNSVDRASRNTTYVYDALNRLTQTIYADNTTNRTVYDGVGRVAQTVDARGTITGFNYDAAGRRLAVTNAVGTSVASTNLYSYDANGNQLTFTDGLGHTTTNVFDVLNRQVQVQFPDGTKTFTGYDAAGRRVAETNQDNIVTRFTYDGAGRLAAVTNALNQVTRYQYDEVGNETAQIDALSRTNAFAYDSMGRRVAHTMPGGQTEGFAYDTAGNLIYDTNFNGVVITNRYDVMNRLTNRASVNGYQISYTYTQMGQRQTMNDASGNYTNTYDLRDRLCTNTTPIGTLYYGYDANGNVTGITSSTIGGTSVTYQYDALNRLTNVVDARLTGAQNTAYRYDTVGNLKSYAYPNAVTNLYQYDALNRLTNLVWKTNGTAIASFAYTLGASGNRTALSENVNGSSRAYAWINDALYRLTNETVSVTAPTGTLIYGYDAVGNRTSRTSSISGLANQTLTYNTNDWLTTDIYDNNGNTRTNAINQPYFYDCENRLTNFNNGQVIIVYDGDGNRVAKMTSTTTNLYLVDTHNPSGYAQVLEEFTVIGGLTNLSKAYTYGLDLISQRVPTYSTNFFAYDGHGSTRLLTDNGGNVVNAFTYDAYGALIASNSTPQTVYLYCGEQYDPDLGFYYNRARYLNPDTGRFWIADSVDGNSEDPLSLHKYIYCQNNPVNGIDPSGHELESLMIGMAMYASLASMPNLVTVADATETLPEEGEKALIDRYNKAKAYLESRNVKHGGSHLASCYGVNEPLGHFMGPMPNHWICRLEHRSHYISIFGLGNWLPDHWAVVCRTAPDVPMFKELLFDYWGDRPAGENPKTWFRNHYEGILPGSFDYTYGQYAKPYDYRWLNVLPIGAD